MLSYRSFLVFLLYFCAMFSVIKGFLVIFILCVTSLIGEFIVGFVCFPLVFLAPAYFRYAFDVMTGSWQSFVIVVLEIVGGVRFVTSGDEFRSGERSLIVMNHRTRLDWMFFWSVLSRQSTTRTLKITLKSALKYLPGPGWAMQCAAYIFLKRRWDEDEKVIKKMLQYYVNLNYPCQILIFPEGTNLTADTKQSSDRFAEKSGLPKVQYVLHPRTTGFTCIADFLLQHKHVDCVYDVTVAYPDSIPENGSDILYGRLPSIVHFHVQRHTVPPADKLATWLTDRWADKEAALHRFYTQPAPPTPAPDTGLACRLRQMGLCMWWCGLVVSALYLLATWWLVRWCAGAWVCVHLIANRLGGLDELQADANTRRYGNRSPPS